jgi:hypothetical protein
MEELIKNYGLPTAMLIGLSFFTMTIVTFLKSLIVKEMGELKHNQELLGKELRGVQDDVARIELMLRLAHDYKHSGGPTPEMSRIGKAGTDGELK